MKRVERKGAIKKPDQTCLKELKLRGKELQRDLVYCEEDV